MFDNIDTIIFFFFLIVNLRSSPPQHRVEPIRRPRTVNTEHATVEHVEQPANNEASSDYHFGQTERLIPQLPNQVRENSEEETALLSMYDVQSPSPNINSDDEHFED